jgi:hypothetical protein
MLAPAARWEAYAPSSRGAHFAYWCERYCRQSIDEWAGEPLVLEPWQQEIMDEALAELDEEEPYWQTVVLVIPRKNGKTSVTAAVSLWHLLEDEGTPEVLLGAATDKQAGRLFETARRFVQGNPELAARVVIRDHEGQIVRSDGFGTIYRFSADTGAAAGWNPSLVVVDELADWSTPRRQRSWAQVVTAGRMARRRAQVFAISTAGEPEQRLEGILGRLIDRNELDGKVERVHRALAISRNHESRTVVFNYDARTTDPKDLGAIKAANPASWVTEERLAAAAAEPGLTRGRFLQLHGCVWATSESGFLELEAWRRLEFDGELEPGEEVVLGFRGGETCALVACRREDGALFTLGIWEPRAGELVDPEDVDDLFQAMLERYPVAAVYAAATPAWATFVNGWRHLLGKQQVIDLDVSSPSPRTAHVTRRFQADALAGRIRHDGNRRLARHMVAARIARARNLPYLAESSRGEAPISGALAALLAWEARTLLGPAVAKQPSRYAFV